MVPERIGHKILTRGRGARRVPVLSTARVRNVMTWDGTSVGVGVSSQVITPRSAPPRRTPRDRQPPTAARLESVRRERLVARPRLA